MTIRIKDYKNNRPGTETMTVGEFAKRFSDHILPPGIQRVRYVGLFGSSKRKERLEICRPLILEYNQYQNLKIAKRQLNQDAEEQPKIDPSACRNCDAKMKLAQRLKAEVMQSIVTASAKLLLLLLEQSHAPEQTPAQRLDALIVSHRWTLKLWYFHGNDLNCLKVFTLALLDAELARLEAEAEQDTVPQQAHPPPIAASGVSDAA